MQVELLFPKFTCWCRFSKIVCLHFSSAIVEYARPIGSDDLFTRFPRSRCHLILPRWERSCRRRVTRVKDNPQILEWWLSGWPQSWSILEGCYSFFSSFSSLIGICQKYKSTENDRDWSIASGIAWKRISDRGFLGLLMASEESPSG